MMAKSRREHLTRPPPLKQSRNKLLAALPAADYQRILPTLTSLPLTFRLVLHKQGSKMDEVYFPGSGVCSVVSTMSDGRMVEVATIGNEGVTGLGLFLGGDTALSETFVQVPGDVCQSMPAATFRSEMERLGPLYEMVSRYSQALQVLIMQSTACNALHSVEERCSRWLLMTRDRVDSNELNLTHEFLGYMLGVRRPTVSLVLGTLDKAGLLRNGNRMITVLDPERLQATSCECYRVVKSAFDRLLPAPR
jgi:CRP-like cAMP-binding protein